ncbi:MAG: hypothetical protein E7A62_07180 [Actinomycetaceae bacterium]|nr:hypothetical protein [Actinomycetaceae bacterium]MDU0970761.1 hypothetical protein [Actinomycetaceae bacterium]
MSPTHRARTKGSWTRATIAGGIVTVLVVCGLVLGLCSGNYAGPAHGYTPKELPANAQLNPKIATTLTTDFKGAEVKPGASFDYKGTVKFDNAAETGFNNVTTTIRFTPDGNAPVSSLATSNFSFTQGSGNVTGVTKNSDGSYTIAVSGVSNNAVLSFTAPATVNANAQPGDIFEGTLDAQTTGTVTVGIAGDSNFTPNPQFTPDTPGVPYDCSGTMEYHYTVKDAGAWLVDIKFGDTAGKGLVIPDTTPLVNGTQDPSSKNSLVVTDPQGRDITAQVLAKMSGYKANDPGKPYRTSSNTANYRIRWVDSMNWNYNEATWTGDTWLDSGTKMVIKRHVRYGNCVGKGVSTDGSMQRELSANVDLGRPNISVSDGTSTSFVMPGTVKNGPFCDYLYIYGDRKTTNSPVARVEFSKLTNTNQVLSGWKQGPLEGGEGYGVSGLPGLDGKHYYLPDRPKTTGGGSQTMPARELRAYDSGTNQSARVKASPIYTHGGGFDSNGLFWVGEYSVSKDKHPSDHKTFVLGTDPLRPDEGWYAVNIAGMTMRSGTDARITDLAFDSEGNLWLVGVPHTGGAVTNIFKVPASDLRAAAAKKVLAKVGIDNYPVVTATNMTNGNAGGYATGKTYGLAFGPNDTMYISQGNYVQRVDNVATGKTTLVATFQQGGVDLASCPMPSSAASFKLRKSVVDPVTHKATPAGTTAANELTLDEHGNGTVDYLVTVANTGTSAGDPGTITDSLGFPAGVTVNDVRVDGVSQGAKTSFTLSPGSLDGGAAKTYRVSVDFSTTLGGTNWSSLGTCNTTDAGTPGSGLFNSVRMDSDSDGNANNDACVPVVPPSKGHLKLVKRVLDENGNDITSQADLSKFQLVAAGGSLLHGTSGVEGDVIAGKYKLSELANGLDSTYLFGKQWTCDSGKTPDADGYITLNQNDNVTCTIDNTRKPKIHIEKLASDPIDGNGHYGKTVTLDGEGKGVLRYTIRVTNGSSFTANTGAITDIFTPPAGLVWDGNKTATVAFVPGSTGATADGLKTALIQSQLAKPGVAIASAVKNIPANGHVDFTIDIPVQANNAVSGGKTIFEANEDNLKKCEAKQTTTSSYVGPSYGATNYTWVENEDTTYSDIPIDDNLACIPVEKSKQAKVHVQKVATHVQQGGTNPHVGQPVTPSFVDGAVSMDYTIEVTNAEATRKATATDVKDTFTVPAGLVWNGDKKARFTLDLNGTSGVVVTQANGTPWNDGSSIELSKADLAGTVGGAVIAKSVADIPAGQTVKIRVSIPLAIDDKAAGSGTTTVFDQHAATLGQCTNKQSDKGSRYTTTEAGVPNTVSITDEDQTYSDIPTEDNVACIPITPPALPTVPALPLTGGVGRWIFGPLGGLLLTIAAGATVDYLVRRKRKGRSR